MANDRAQLLKGRALMSMPNFIVFSMENQYGIRSIALRYLQEMYVGLSRHRGYSPRVSAFAASTGMFEDDTMPQVTVM